MLGICFLFKINHKVNKILNPNEVIEIIPRDTEEVEGEGEEPE